MTAPHVIAVVLNWRDAPSTAVCVASLLAEDGVASVVLVDNESTGELRALAGDRVTLIEQPDNLGFSRGVNVGLRHALSLGADAALVINNDATLEPHAFAAMVDAWQEHGGRAGLIAPIVRYADGTLQSSGGRVRGIDAATDDLVGAARANYLTWACVLVPRATLEEVGLLDERFFMYWEDVDYGLRVLDAGRELVVAEHATVIHEKSKSHARAGVAIEKYSARGLVILARTHRGTLLYSGLPVRTAARVLKRIIQGRPAHARAVVEGVIEGWRAE
ncbi:MAG: glycosyltransferase family 2 protein [Microbacterium sp.]|nr:MAG: glycosyltransferase family 2 protein [Microbacterium sp.]